MSQSSSSIAIIGFSLRFPDAATPEAFWQNLLDGVESVRFLKDDELLAQGIPATLLQDPHYVKAGIPLANRDQFDADFFSMSAREAAIMDPQLRLMIECAHEAFEQAGYAVERFPGSVGVYVGQDPSRYYLQHLLPQAPEHDPQAALQLLYNNAVAATQISYKLNLQGPSLDINTACSTSLTAIHVACQSLLNYECDMAIAGGASIDPSGGSGYLHQEGSILSPDGHCRVFDGQAQGTVPGSGVGLIVLKRLDDAILEQDTIHAVIRGSAINNDGSLKVGYTAPSVQGQAAVIEQALAAAQVDPASIDYVECHGTGTLLGDPIEVAALTEAFQPAANRTTKCLLGSVKSNIGHLSAAAGVAGVIKTVLALKHQQLPASLHFQSPNPQIDFDNSPFQVNAQNRAWQASGKPRLAGVSSFGIGGTNAHLILEEAPPVAILESTTTWHLLMLSAKTPAALQTQREKLYRFLQTHPEAALADVAYTLQVGRQIMPCRWAAVCRSVEEALNLLTSLQPKDGYGNQAPEDLVAAAQQWCDGLTEEPLQGYPCENRRRIPLPTYPFQRQRYWIDSPRMQQANQPVFHARPASLHTLYAAAETTLEKELAEEWSLLLGIKPIGIHDNFFDLNGDSLNMMQLASSLYQRYNLRLPIDQLFAKPTIAEMAQAIALRSQPSDCSLLPPAGEGARRADEGLTTLVSYAQQRLWFLDQFEGPGPTYNMPCALTLRGEWRLEALTASLQAIVDRHDSLRTSFNKTEDGVVQVIHPAVRITIPVRTVTAEELDRVIQEDIQQPFDLTQTPLLRAGVYQLGSQEAVFVITMHHIVTDGWSQRILLREFAQFYQAAAQGKVTVLPALPMQYADYSRWQRDWLQGEELNRQLAYWQHQLRDLPASLELPTDRPRPLTQTYAGDSVQFELPSGLIQALTALGREQGATLFMVLFAAFNVLLYRYSGKEDIAVGTPIAGRNRKEFESLIGFFVNTLVLRSRLDPSWSFRALLEAVKQTTLQAFEHQDIAFDKLVEVLQPERHLSHSPLVQVEFAWQNAVEMELTLDQLTASVYPLKSSVAKFDLTFYLQETAESVLGLAEYNTDLFDQSTIQRLIDNYIQLLNSIVQCPDNQIVALDLLSEAQRQQLLVTWNQPTFQYNVDKPASLLFSEQAARSPDAIAITHDGQHFTYVALERRANQLAHALMALGVEREQRVALYLPRGIDFLVCLLGVLKAGAAFVPLNPDSSFSRNLDILSHCEPAVILTNDQHEPAIIDALPFIPVIRYSPHDCQSYSDLAPEWTGELNDLACFFYTSGSTGKPKGVMVEQLGMVNHLLAKNGDLHISASDVIAQMAVQTFDVCVWQCLCALLVGGRTVILTDGEAWEPQALLAALDREKVTVFESVPSHTNIILDELENHPSQYPLPTVRCYVSNGEAMPREQSARWFRLIPHVELVNTYGSTECSDDISHFHLDAQETFSMPYVPTQGVLPNMQLYILDCRLNPVPIGVVGEVYVGGIGVGRGYWRDEARTQGGFLADPFSTRAGARLYRTGDMARYHANGYMEFIGRVDFQVKIRGFRVEVGEVEAVLVQHDNIRQVLVVPWKDSRGVQHLIGYAVPKQHPAPTVNALSQFCLTRLPHYMVPSTFIFLEAFPLAANGKTDRKQLPVPNERDLTLEDNYVEPRTPLESTVAALWADMLGLEKVGIRDNFFQIGGHSLVAVDLVNKMQQTLKTEIPLRQLFDSPTIESLMDVLS